MTSSVAGKRVPAPVNAGWQLAEVLDVERVEVDAVPAAGGPEQLGAEPLDESSRHVLRARSAAAARRSGVLCAETIFA